ncbi:MAG TPA: GNAT family N-acetyltransferase [Solirubrobacteraceae bacterium]|nr:GNAT family N-acetyltransferase [Solirubrobacteraceae bacterium]
MSEIAIVGEAELSALLPLMRDYCDFYGVAPSDEALLAMSRALIAEPEREGIQFIAREPDGDGTGFATVFWTWTTLGASRLGVMNDLFVIEPARGTGLADRLIAACRERCAAHGATALAWQTAKDNHRAQAVYDRVGARRSEWFDYSLPV